VPTPDLPGELDAVQDVPLGLRAEAAHLPNLFLAGRRFQVVEVLDPQRLVQRPDRLRADPLDARQFAHLDGEFRPKLGEFLDLAGRGVLGDLLGDGLADPVDLLQFVGGQFRHSSWMIADVLGRPPVGARLVLDAVGFEEVRELL